MHRRSFLQALAAACFGSPVLAAMRQDRLEAASALLAQAATDGVITHAVLHVVQRADAFTRTFGKAANADAMFLLGSISKPIAMTALMSLFDKGLFKLSDPVQKYLPAFKGDRREAVTMQHLLTHVSGLPDQLAENNDLRRSHASLAEFAEHAMRVPLHFEPGTKYEYSSMAILLASRVAEILSGRSILDLVESAVLGPLGMHHSAQGLGRFQIGDFVPVQTEHAAPESGGGDPTAKEWDWNSPYWRKLGAPWGGAHASAPDLARFLSEFLHAKGAAVKPETARLMTTNQNPAGLESRGLGFDVDLAKGLSAKSFGHTGSTGTIAWADPATETICVILTSLPARAIHPHPRDLASEAVIAAIS